MRHIAAQKRKKAVVQAKARKQEIVSTASYSRSMTGFYVSPKESLVTHFLFASKYSQSTSPSSGANGPVVFIPSLLVALSSPQASL